MTGFELLTKATQSVNFRALFTGRLWGRTGCSTNSTGKFICATGDSGSGQISCDDVGGIILLFTLVEFTLAEKGDRDYYDICLVDGFNVPVSISPRGGSGNTCITASCARDVNSDCPNELAVKGQSGNSVIGCKNACEVFNQPEYCCTESSSTPNTCKPTNYSMFFKNQCHQAYSCPYDHSTSCFLAPVELIIISLFVQMEESIIGVGSTAPLVF
ncbi:hypothetical protein JCGZ_08557 [Jatropha curcas]|uniref:Thaumatin-like protein n=1 Tax=Jatropha curcas TaxID=180498 RepID=A0A067KXG4_JATCU|nr:thaumatin-like protein 1 [Jatropha curcas]KDP36965.1 hypothetical protein JCGZ_08557 [Jatropha curcas]